jgi:AcrR family transcriptional regulator
VKTSLNGNGLAGSNITTSPRRAGLVQERSRQTRRRLVRAALELWSERGFETGIEETTVEEIAQAAGVTKGTFYFHFARKEEILLEMGFQTAQLLQEESDRCMSSNRSLTSSLRRLMNTMAHQITAAPPAAVGRALAEFRRPPRPEAEPPSGPMFREAFEPLFARAQDKAEVTVQVKPHEMALILEAVVLESIVDWSRGATKLDVTLRRHAAIILAGLQSDNRLSL